jgi:hypothetical protein
MKRFPFTTLATLLIVVPFGSIRAADQDAKAILEKAAAALGGKDKLAKVDAMTWKAKGKISFNGNSNEFKSESTVKGLTHFHSQFHGNFDGNPIEVSTVLNGDKGWRKFNDNVNEMEPDGIANEKRTIYLAVLPVTIVPLLGADYKLEVANEEKIGDKTAVGVKATGKDGKDFTIHFDKESGLPVKLTAVVVGFGGEEYTQETTFGDYKDFDGVKKAVKVEVKRDGTTFIEQEISDFKVLDQVDDSKFNEPK